MDKSHLSANKGRLLQHKERLLQHKGRLLWNKEQAKESHGTPIYVISMSLVCRFYVVSMSFADYVIVWNRIKYDEFMLYVISFLWFLIHISFSRMKNHSADWAE